MGTNRCGTTYIFRLLEKYMNAQSKSYDEPFAKAITSRSKDWDKSIKYFHQTISELSRAVLVKDHAQTIEIVKDTLKTLDDYNALYLDFYKIKVLRKNFKQAVISMALARTTNRYHYTKAKYKNDSESVRVSIDKDTFIQCLASMHYGFERLYELPDSMFDEVVMYEDLTGDNKLDQEIIKYTCANVKNIDLDMVRSPNQSDMISNYDEVCEWFDDEIKKYTSNIFTIEDGMIK